MEKRRRTPIEEIPEADLHFERLKALSDTRDFVGLYFREAGMVPLLTEFEEKELAETYEKGKRAGVTLWLGDQAKDVENQQVRRMSIETIMHHVYSERIPAAWQEMVTDSDKVDEVTNLFRSFGEGIVARERMIRANTRLVVSVAKKYIDRGIPFIDLIQEGNTALLKAVDRFEPDRGFRFSSLAVSLIERKVRRYIAAELEHRNSSAFSFDAPIDPTNPDSALSVDYFNDERVASVETETQQSIELQQLQDALDELSPEQRVIIKERFGLVEVQEKPTLTRLGRDLGIPYKNVQRLEKRALRFLLKKLASPNPERGAK